MEMFDINWINVLTNIVSFTAIFAVIWWMIFFIVLPFGVEVPERPKKGFANSAPITPNIKKKAKYTSVISLILTIVFYLFVHYGYIDMRAIINNIYKNLGL